jgi:hypothetical protein
VPVVSSDGREGVDDDSAGVGEDDLFADRFLALDPVRLAAFVLGAILTDLPFLAAGLLGPVERAAA